MSDYWAKKFADAGIDIASVERDTKARSSALAILPTLTDEAKMYIEQASQGQDIIIAPALTDDEYRMEMIQRDYVASIAKLGKLDAALFNSGHRHILTSGDAETALGLEGMQTEGRNLEVAGFYSNSYRIIVTEYEPPFTIGSFTYDPMQRIALHESFHAMSALPQLPAMTQSALLEKQASDAFISEVEALSHAELERLQASGDVLLALVGQNAGYFSVTDNSRTLLTQSPSTFLSQEGRSYFPRTAALLDAAHSVVIPDRISADARVIEAYSEDIATLESQASHSVLAPQSPGALTCNRDTVHGDHYIPYALGGHYATENAREEALVEVMADIVRGQIGTKSIVFYLPQTANVGLELLDTWEIAVDPMVRAQIQARAELKGGPLCALSDTEAVTSPMARMPAQEGVSASELDRR